MGQTGGDGAGFFADNRLVKVCAGLDNFNIAGEAEKNNLLKYAVDRRVTLRLMLIIRFPDC